MIKGLNIVALVAAQVTTARPIENKLVAIILVLQINIIHKQACLVVSFGHADANGALFGGPANAADGGTMDASFTDLNAVCPPILPMLR